MTNLPSHEYVATKLNAYLDEHNMIYDVAALADTFYNGNVDPNWVAEAVPELAGLLDDEEVISYDNFGSGPGYWTCGIYYNGYEVARLTDEESP